MYLGVLARNDPHARVSTCSASTSTPTTPLHVPPNCQTRVWQSIGRVSVDHAVEPPVDQPVTHYPVTGLSPRHASTKTLKMHDAPRTCAGHRLAWGMLPC